MSAPSRQSTDATVGRASQLTGRVMITGTVGTGLGPPFPPVPPATAVPKR